MRRVVGRLIVVGLLATGVGCGSDCPTLPAIKPLRISVSVAGAGGPVQAVEVHVDGSSTTGGGCTSQADRTECSVPLPGGVHVVEVSAPGYQTVQRTVAVPYQGTECGRSDELQPLDIALVANPLALGGWMQAGGMDMPERVRRSGSLRLVAGSIAQGGGRRRRTRR
jgi:hypothetical protein